MKKFFRIISALLIISMLAVTAVSCKQDTDELEQAATVGGEGDDQSEQSSEDKGDNAEVEQGGTQTDSTDTDSGSGKTDTDTNGTAAEDKTDSSGNNTIDADGNVTNTQNNYTTDENFHINETISNVQNFIPDEEQGLEKSERRATAESKYDFNKNPLINRDRQENRDSMPSFDINDTGFVRSGTKLEDLKGKTLVFIGNSDSIWSYKNDKGEYVSEFEWMDNLKKELGLTLKRTASTHAYQIAKTLQTMNAGKQLDLIYANNVTWPSALTISRSITDITNIAKGTSPGVCQKTMEVLKWGNTYRVIAPIGESNVLWYNQTLTQELGLSDPHKMWEAGQWNWDTFKSFMLSIPKKTGTGDNLVAFAQWASDGAYVWPGTNGDLHIYNVPDAEVPTVKNNWDGPTVMEAWEFIAGILNTIEYARGDATVTRACYQGLFQGTTLMTSTIAVQKYVDTEYSKNVRINWVPFPKSNNPGGRDVAQFRGYAMLLPRKTIKSSNVDIALKFMELWATRFTEATFDNLSVYEYHAFDYYMRKQYFDFVTETVIFHMAVNDFQGTTIHQESKFYAAINGQVEYNVRTEATKARNIVTNFLKEQMKFGN